MYGPAEHTVSAGADPEYRRRRAAVDDVVARWRVGDPLPEILYTAQERDLWTAVCRRLYASHTHHASAHYLEGWEALGLQSSRIPALDAVDRRLTALTGFALHPSAGWLPGPAYFAALAERRFPTTLHVRDPGRPDDHDPDLLHSLVGHAVLLAVPRFARLHRVAGQTALRLRTDAARAVLARVFWFTCEMGVLKERGRSVCWGARLLSSPSGMEAFRAADVVGLDLHAMARGAGQGSVLYRAESGDALEEQVTVFLDGLDEDTPARLGL